MRPFIFKILQLNPRNSLILILTPKDKNHVYQKVVTTEESEVLWSVVHVDTELLRLYVLALDTQGVDDDTSIKVESIAIEYCQEVKEVSQIKVFANKET